MMLLTQGLHTFITVATSIPSYGWAPQELLLRLGNCTWQYSFVIFFFFAVDVPSCPAADNQPSSAILQHRPVKVL